MGDEFLKRCLMDTTINKLAEYGSDLSIDDDTFSLIQFAMLHRMISFNEEISDAAIFQKFISACDERSKRVYSDPYYSVNQQKGTDVSEQEYTCNNNQRFTNFKRQEPNSNISQTLGANQAYMQPSTSRQNFYVCANQPSTSREVSTSAINPCETNEAAEMSQQHGGRQQNSRTSTTSQQTAANIIQSGVTVRNSRYGYTRYQTTFVINPIPDDVDPVDWLSSAMKQVFDHISANTPDDCKVGVTVSSSANTRSTAFLSWRKKEQIDTDLLLT
jgi:hypothetical protein